MSAHTVHTFSCVTTHQGLLPGALHLYPPFSYPAEDVLTQNTATQRVLHSLCVSCVGYSSSLAPDCAHQHCPRVPMLSAVVPCCTALVLPLLRWPYTASMQYVAKAVWVAQQARVQRQLQGIGPTGSSSAPAPVSGGSGVMGRGSRGHTSGPAGGSPGAQGAAQLQQ
jgi:hypothetical protein